MTPHIRNVAVAMLMSTCMEVPSLGDEDQTKIDKRPLLKRALAGAR